MKLYYSKGACSLAVRITINEIGLKCEFESVNLKTKQTETGADYWKINPKGAVPAIVVEKNTVLTENTAIQQYLAEVNKADQLLPPVGDFKRYRVLEWLSFISTELHKGFGPLFNPNLSQEIKDQIIIPQLKNKFNYVEQQIKDNKFLLGDAFTLADSYLFVMLFWLPNVKIDMTEWPRLTKYFNAMKKHKSVEKSLKEEGFII